MTSTYTPQVDYTSRDYSAIRDDLIANIPNFAPQWTSRSDSDFGIVLIELFAYMGDLMSYYIDRAANESFISTATQRDSVLSIANLYGYSVGAGTAASATLTFSNSSAAIITIPALTKVATSASLGAVSSVVFETSALITVPAAIAGVPGATTVLANQGTTVTGEVLASASDGTPNQIYQLAQSTVDTSSIAVMVGSVAYNSVPHLLDYSGDSPVFVINTDSNGNTFVTFGDNLGGRIPPLNSAITTTYRVIAGTTGNVPAVTLNYILSNFTPGLSVVNVSAAIGGSDPESTDSIRINAPLSIRALSRAVTLDDYTGLAIQVAGVGKVSSSANVFSSVNVYMAPIGGGGLSGTGGITGIPTAAFNTLSSAVSTYLSDKIPPNTTVTINPPVYVPVNISADIYILSSYRQADTISNATTGLLSLLDFIGVVFGQRISLQSVLSALATIDGIDYSTVTTLSRTTGIGDVTCAINEIPVIGTITLTPHGGIV